MAEMCEWDNCDEPQHEDWFYCEVHVRAVESMNGFLRGVVSDV